MSSFALQDFWREIFSKVDGTKRQDIAGWYSKIEKAQHFIEPPISYSPLLEEQLPAKESKILLVSAPGAVGKTTLAKEIANRTGAIYVDLAESEPVGGNTLSGGLFKVGALTDWQNGKVALLVDGLDEARLKVTQEGFCAFLDDAAFLAKNGALPIVIFGRTGAIQDAWIMLTDKAPTSVLEIGYYSPKRALEFTKTRLTLNGRNSQHFEAESRALEALLSKLRAGTQNDGDRFSGYAPVLNAISDFVKNSSNPSAIISSAEKGDQPITLREILKSILIREQQKLRSLVFDDPKLNEVLYSPEEQINRLVSIVYNLSKPALPKMSANDSAVYSNALETWVPEHPFLYGTKRPASAVFEAAIVSQALNNPQTSDKAASQELAKGAAANPFIPEFYFHDAKAMVLPPEHVGVIYSSLRARLAQGDHASLSIEGFDDEKDEKQLQSEIEISITRSGEDISRVYRYTSDQVGTIRLGSHIEDVEVSAAQSTVDIGGYRELIIVPPISIQCKHLIISAEKVIVEGSSKRDDNVAMLEASTADVSSVKISPILNGSARLIVIWENSEQYPWNSLRGNPSTRSDPKEKEALRRFRKFVIAFRSHSKGSLKRVAAKLDHERMTKGSGLSILNKLKAFGIITKDGAMYTLHPDKLSDLAGAAYSTTMAQEYSSDTIKFVTEAIPP